VSAVRRLDAWIGKRIMHPPIIWVCQRAGVTQFAVFRFLWWIVGLQSLLMSNPTHVLWRTFCIVFAIATTVSAAVWPDRPVKADRGGLRAWLWAWLLLDLLCCIALRKWSWGLTNLALALLAEYAATIVTIPPRKSEQMARRLKLARLGA